MRIGINARYLQSRQTGIRNYLLNLLLKLKEIDSGNEYVLFFGSDKPVPEVVLDAGFEYDIPKMSTGTQALKFLWTHFYLPCAIKRKKIDLFHESSFIAPMFKKCPTVVTVHDVAYLYIPFCYTYRTRLYFEVLLTGSIRKSNVVIAVSESVKKDIVNNFSVSPDKIKVIYEGVDEMFRPIDDIVETEREKKICGIKGDFILVVSGVTPRKNLIRLIRAFKLLRDGKKTNAQLVIVGEKAWWSEEIFREAESCGDEDDIIFCGYLPDKDLICLYNSAKVFVHPSLYEGFGLPILEAMACGCPVVASNVSSIPEICGGAALLVDPENVEGLADAVHRVMNDEFLRKSLIEKGIKRARKFSWKKTAEETLAVYSAVGA